MRKESKKDDDWPLPKEGDEFILRKPCKPYVPKRIEIEPRTHVVYKHFDSINRWLQFLSDLEFFGLTPLLFFRSMMTFLSDRNEHMLKLIKEIEERKKVLARAKRAERIAEREGKLRKFLYDKDQIIFEDQLNVAKMRPDIWKKFIEYQRKRKDAHYRKKEKNVQDNT